MAKRYDEKLKKKVVSFIESYNSKNGRGGQSAAGKKFGINHITLRKWMDQAGKLERSQRKRSRTRGSSKDSAANSKVEVLKRMGAIQEKLETLRAEFDQLKELL